MPKARETVEQEGGAIDSHLGTNAPNTPYTGPPHWIALSFSSAHGNGANWESNPTMSKLTHLNDKGEAHMVDVSNKGVTHRTARAEGFVAMAVGTLALIETGTAKKGDVLAAARIAGIMAAKRTHELIPLCHPLAITQATVAFEASRDPPGVRVSAVIKVSGQTGVEMEALTAVSVACLTIYDMVKAADKTLCFENIRLVEKTGGRSGDYRAADRKGR
jgi:cyclic pyranopterin phosphate synthase